MTHADSTRTPPADPADSADPVDAAHPEDAETKGGIRDRSVREVVERTRDVIRKTRELLDNSRDLLDRVRHGDKPDDRAHARLPEDEDGPGEHDADEGSDDHAGVDARPVDGRA